MPTVTKSLGDGTQSVLLTVAILESVARTNGPVSISELAREIGTSKSRIFRHLQTLMSCDYIASPGSGGEYEAGSQLLAFCRAINERHDLVNLAKPIMSELRERFGHTVIVSRVDMAGVHVLRSLSGHSPIVVGIRAGTVLPFALSAQGKVSLAFMPSARRNAKGAFSAAYGSFAREHADELEAIRRQGFAAAQMREGLNGLAAPVLDDADNLIATLALLDTAADMEADSIETKGRALIDAAGRLSRACGAAGIRSG